MRFSIIVPTYNEEHDIVQTLESLVALDWPDYEIIVVDDSTDRTPDIVRGYADRGVSLIIPAVREGRCGARNLGIMAATGEVVVVLNADTHLFPDFLRRIEPHYVAGADYVLVRSVVENIDDLFARYVESSGIALFYGQDPELMEWTEGFSCRREMAIRAGLFPTGYAVPICAGEDGFFGTNLRKLGARKKVDLDIVVTHVAPAPFGEYWNIRKGRGQGSPQIRRFLQKWSFFRVGLRASIRVVYTCFMTATLLPMLLVCFRYASVSPRGLRDLLPFCWAWLIEQVAFSVGEWQSLLRIYRTEHANSSV